MDEMNKDICFMFDEMKGCTGSIHMSVCGPNCPFRKTKEQQMRAEKKIVKRFYNMDYIGSYKSCIDGTLLYKNDGKEKVAFLEV